MEKEGLFLSILDLLRRVPRRMLMVLKLNDLTRALDASLHTTHGPIRPFVIAARYCSLAVWRDDKSKLSDRWSKNGFSFSILKDYLVSWFGYFYFYRGLAILEGISDAKARTSKIYKYAGTVVKGKSLKDARRSAAGLDDQQKRKQKETMEYEKAKKDMADE